MAEEEAAKNGEGVKEEVKPPNTLEKITVIKEKLTRVHNKVEKLNLEMELETLQIQHEGERTKEINVKLASGIPRYGPEAAALRDELEKIKQSEEKRKTAKDEELKKKADKLKTNKARDSPIKDNKNSEKTKTKSSENLAPKTETQIKLDKLKAKKKMIEDAEKEKHKAHAGRHTNCMGETVQQLNGVPSFGKPGSRGGTATSWSRLHTVEALRGNVLTDLSGWGRRMFRMSLVGWEPQASGTHGGRLRVSKSTSVRTRWIRL